MLLFLGFRDREAIIVGHARRSHARSSRVVN
jgi:hypothetical protein